MQMVQTILIAVTTAVPALIAVLTEEKENIAAQMARTIQTAALMVEKVKN